MLGLVSTQANGNMIYSSSGKIVVLKGLNNYVVVDEDKVKDDLSKRRRSKCKGITSANQR